MPLYKAAGNNLTALVAADGSSGGFIKDSQAGAGGLAVLDDATIVAAHDTVHAAGADIASVAGVTDIGAATGGYAHITGTEVITGLGTVAAGTYREVKFTGACTLTYNATSLILPGAADIVTAANDTAAFRSLGSGNWVCLWYKRQSESPYLATTWTPSIAFATPGDSSIAYATQVGTYIKIGSLVLVTFNILTSGFTHSTASGNLTLSGLPFTANNDVSEDHHVGCLSWAGITKANYTQVTPRISPNATTAVFVASGSAQSASNITAADMPTGGTVTLRGQIIYRTA